MIHHDKTIVNVLGPWRYPIVGPKGHLGSFERSFGRHEKCIYGGRVQWVSLERVAAAKTMWKMDEDGDFM